MGLGKSLKKVGHKISHGVKKLGKSTSFKRGIGGAVIGGLLAGPAGALVGGVATGAISNAHNKHKASKKKNKNSIFEGSCNKSTSSGCCGKSTKTSGCSTVQPVTSCSSTVQQPTQCYPQMDSNMFMNFINNIFEKLISLIEKLSRQQTVNNNYNNYNYNNFNHNDYNTYNTTNTYNDIDNILNNNLSVFNNKIDNDIYKYNVLGNNNQVVTYDA